MESTVIVENVNVDYYGKAVLKNISISLPKGIHILLGSSGSGKTTLLKTIAGLVKPKEGRVLVKGIDVSRTSRRVVSSLVAYTWQNPYYGFTSASVRDEISFILKNTGRVGDWSIVERLVPRELMDRDPFTLSGGEARRVSIASVLVADQDVWLLDEPFNDLDADGVDAMTDLIIYGKSRGKTIIISSNSTVFPNKLDLSKAIVLSEGRLTYYGDYVNLDLEILGKGKVLHRGIYCGETL